MKLQLRFFLVFVTIFLLAVSYLSLQQKFEIDRSNKVLASELKQRKTYLQSIVGLEGRSIQAFDEDYSFWDAMVTFIKADNVSFAHENLDTGLSTFNTDADWAYRPNGTLVYFSSASGSNALQILNLPSTFFKQLSTSKFAHFYIRDNHQIVEIRAATVVPSDDPDHKTPEQGFLLIGRVLNKAYTKSIANLSSSNITLAASTDTKDVTTGNTVSFGETLLTWNGQPLAVLRSTSSVSVITDLKQDASHQLELLTIFTLLSLTFIVWLLWLLVLRPITIVNKAIKQKKPELLNILKDQHTEFGTLAETVAEFFQQKISLSEAEFKQTELEKLNKEKASFLAVAAHELNGPVTNVKTFVELLEFLLQNKKTHDDSAIEKQVHAIEHQTIKMTMLLNDLYAASSGKQGLEFKMRDFDFDAFLKEEVEEAALSIKKHVNLFCTTKATLHSDPDRLGQVITNLMRNAAKYSPDSDDILVRGRLENNRIVVGIQDFGLGIAPEDIPHLFERFYRSGKVSTSIPGLGLGLYISKTIIETLDGNIWVESEYGRGSTFYIALPLKSPPV